MALPIAHSSRSAASGASGSRTHKQPWGSTCGSAFSDAGTIWRLWVQQLGQTVSSLSFSITSSPSGSNILDIYWALRFYQRMAVLRGHQKKI